MNDFHYVEQRMLDAETHVAHLQVLSDELGGQLAKANETIALLEQERDKFKNALYVHVQYPSTGAAWEKAADANARSAQLEAQLEGTKTKLAALQKELHDTQILLAEKDDTATTFMNQVKSLQIKISLYECLMARDNSTGFVKWICELAARLDKAASDMRWVEPLRTDIKEAARQLQYLAQSFTLKANFVPCRLAMNQAKQLFQSLDAAGGLGFERHEKIRAAITNIDETLKSINLPP